MNFKFNQIDMNGFQRIWDSGHYDQHIDSWENSFADTLKVDWKPIWEKAKEVWREVELESGDLIGYIFLSEKTDGSAHLGYGLYKNFRGKGYSVPMCKQFLLESVPKLSNSTYHLLGTTLSDNLASKAVLEKLGFSFHQEVVEHHNDVDIVYDQFKRDLAN